MTTFDDIPEMTSPHPAAVDPAGDGAKPVADGPCTTDGPTDPLAERSLTPHTGTPARDLSHFALIKDGPQRRKTFLL